MLNQRTRHGLTIHAAFCLAFAACLQTGESSWEEKDRRRGFADWHITRRSIALFEDHLELSLPASETDPTRKELTILVANKVYAVTLIRRLLRD